MSKKKVIIGIIILGAVAALVAFTRGRGAQTQYFTTAVSRGNVEAVVEATGTINAVTTVQVGSQVSGTIDKLFADFNSKVKKGEVIARIDPSLFQGALLQANADLANAKANYAAAQANLEKAQASAVQTKADYQRTVSLAKEGVLSQQQLDLAKANAQTGDAEVSAAQAQMVQAKAQVSQKAAAVSVAQTNLDHTIITAPIDGTVVNRSVDVGQTVAASLQAPTLFTIAQDLTKMQVYAKTDESDVGKIRVGQEVNFKVDAFPNETFRGNVSQIRMDATTVQNVVTYDTIVDFNNPDLKLFPGMTAYVTIPYGIANDVLKIPNGALRYKPDMTPAELRAAYQKYGIEMGGAGKTKGGDGSANSSATGADSTTAAAGQPVHARHGGMTGGGGRPGGGKSGSSADTSGGDESGGVGIVWRLNKDKSVQPIKVKFGITDLTYTALIDGDLKEGDLLITNSTKQGGMAGSRPPGMAGPRR